MDFDNTLDPKQRGAAQATARATALTVVGHPDPRRVGDRVLLTSGQSLELGRAAPALKAPGSASPGAPLNDPYISRKPVVFTQGPAGLTIDASRTSTAVHVDGELVDTSVSRNSAALGHGVTVRLADRVVLLAHRVTANASGPQAPDAAIARSILGASDGVRALRTSIRQVADLHIPVLVRGPTGAGKELVAQAIRALSPRASGPFVAVNLAAVGPTLAASELFGHVRGAFTGAVREHQGAFERADGGTLFLDEVGDAPADVQVMLLRVLETREVQRVGDVRTRAVDVRVIAATDADLDAGVRDGSVRAALLHRLAGVQLRVPSLADRRDDIGRLFYHFLGEEMATLGEAAKLQLEDLRGEPWLPAELVERLVRYSWPGNVRELRNAARRVAIAGRHQPTLALGPWVDDLLSMPAPAAPAAPMISAPAAPPAPAKPKKRASYRDPAEVTDAELVAALEKHGYRPARAATELGVSRTSIYALIEASPSVVKAPDLSPDDIKAAAARCGDDPDAMARTLKVSRHAMLARMTALGLR